MKQLTVILLLTSSLCYGQDYATNEADIKERKKAAKQKILTGVVLIGFSVLAKSQDYQSNADVVNYGAGVIGGAGAVIGVKGTIDLIEANKEKKAIRKDKNKRKQD